MVTTGFKEKTKLDFVLPRPKRKGSKCFEVPLGDVIYRKMGSIMSVHWAIEGSCEMCGSTCLHLSLLDLLFVFKSVR